MRKKLLTSFCAWLFTSAVLFAQTKTVTGKVTDVQNGTPLSGVTLSSNGKALGVTNADGSFSVTIPTAAKKIAASYVGFNNLELSVSDKAINFRMVADDKSLNEVVVTGYQTLQKRQVTGSIAVVKGETFKNTPIGSFDQMLQGQAAGVLIQANSGQPGAAARVLIRGVGSVTGTTEPLYVLDGIQITAANFSSINPNDFESISVLKDASTTAQYGSRGANGVIVITTKQGKAGKTKFDYNGQYGQSRFPVNKLVVMNTNQKLDYEIARGNPYGWSATDLDSLRNINTNWLDEISQVGITQNHQLSASGGNDKTKFFVSGGLFNQTGTVKKTALNRYNFRANLDHSVNQNLKFGVNSYAGWSNFQNTSEDNTGIATPLNAIRWANPYEQPFTTVFNPATLFYSQFASGQPNPLQDINESNRGEKELKIIASAFVEAKLPFIVKGLSFRTQWGVDYENQDRTNLFTRFGNIGIATTGNQGRFDKRSRTLTRYTGTTSLNFAKKVGDHNFSVGVYNEFINRIVSNFGFSSYGLTGNLQNGAGITNGSATFIPGVFEDRSENALISFFGLGSYSFKDKYFLNTSVRRDGSSRFGANNRFANFYSVGAGWVISDENFFKNVRFIDNLKLSSSYGTVGNQEGIPDFNAREAFGPRTYLGVNGPGLNRLPNQDLTWEERQKFNIGVNLSVLKNRVTFGFDYYNEITNRLFLNNQLSRTTGFSALSTNIGKVRNRGFEFTLTTENIKTRDFRWTTNINFTINRNKLLELTPTTPPNGVVGGTTIQRIGFPLNSNFLVKYAGVNPTNGNAIYQRLNGVNTELYNDVDDRQIFGTRDAPFFGGFTNKLSYKNFDFSFFFSYVFGNLVFNNDRTNVEDPSYFGDNMSVEVAKEWRKAGDVTNIPRSSQRMRTATTRFLEDGSFLRLRNVQLSYSLPASVAKTIKLTNVRFFVMGENLWTGTKFLGFDPELSNGTLSGAQYPALRTITAGLTLGF